jgi:hypothetical protein
MTSNNRRDLFSAKSDFCSLITANSHRKIKQVNLRLKDQEQKTIDLSAVYLAPDLE